MTIISEKKALFIYNYSGILEIVCLSKEVCFNVISLLSEKNPLITRESDTVNLDLKAYSIYYITTI